MSPASLLCGDLREVPREGESILGPRARADYRIDVSTGCWLWLKFTLRGYGVTGNSRAYRLYYERAFGPIPDGFHVHHKCRNPPCVNPEHLEALPPREHFQEHLAHRGLSLEDIREIHRLGQVPGETAREIAARYGIHLRTVLGYWRSDRWAAELEGVDAARVERHCGLCDADITAMRRSAKYCSASCRRTKNKRLQNAREAA